MKRLKFYSLLVVLVLSTSVCKAVKIKIESLIFDIDNNVASVAAVGFPYTDEIVIPSQIEVEGDLFPVTSIGENAFSGSTVKILTIPSSIKSMGDGAFRSTNIEKLYIESLESWCDIDFALQPDDFFSITYVPEYTTTANPISRSTSIYVNGNLLENLEIPETIEELKPFTFARINTASVKFSSKMKKTGKGAFIYSNIKDLVIPESIEEISYCSFMGSYFENISINGETYIDTRAFYNLKKLNEITFNGYIYIETEAFENCLTPIDINMTSPMWGVFTDAFKDTIINVVNVPSAEVWLKSGLHSDNAGYLGYYNLAINEELIDTLCLPNIQPNYIKNINGLGNVQNLIFEEGWEEIWEFMMCPVLESISFPGTFKKIGFWDSSLNLPPSVTEICLHSKIPPTLIINNRMAKTLYENCVLKVPEESVILYINDSEWGKFQNIEGTSFADIDEVKKEPDNDSMIIYDLFGKRVNPEDLTNGIYIINGKKVLFKQTQL